MYHGYTILRKTIERSLFLLDLYLEEMIAHLWYRLNEICFHLSTDAYVDRLHTQREGTDVELTLSLAMTAAASSFRASS